VVGIQLGNIPIQQLYLCIEKHFSFKLPISQKEKKTVVRELSKLRKKLTGFKKY